MEPPGIPLGFCWCYCCWWWWFFVLFCFVLVNSTPSVESRVWTHDPDIKTGAEFKSQILNHLSHPGAPTSRIFLKGPNEFPLCCVHQSSSHPHILRLTLIHTKINKYLNFALPSLTQYWDFILSTIFLKLYWSYFGSQNLKIIKQVSSLSLIFFLFVCLFI